VFVVFGTGVAACYDLDGVRIWARIVEKPTDEYGHSSSPLLAGGKLLILINSLHALDAATGATVWTATAKHAWGSPVLTKIGSESVVLCPGGELVRWRDGKVLTTKSASVGHCSPVVAGGVLYFIEASAHAVRFETPKRPDKLKRKGVWNVTLRGDRYYASPLVHEGVIYAVGQHGEFTTLDAQTGAILHEHKLELPGKVTFYSSPILAGGHVFITADDGTTFVFTAEREPKLVAKNPLEPTRSSFYCDGSRIFVRTLGALWQFAE
jgi:outer membrane protein assembly factor BamB